MQKRFTFVSPPVIFAWGTEGGGDLPKTPFVQVERCRSLFDSQRRLGLARIRSLAVLEDTSRISNPDVTRGTECPFRRRFARWVQSADLGNFHRMGSMTSRDREGRPCEWRRNSGIRFAAARRLSAAPKFPSYATFAEP